MAKQKLASLHPDYGQLIQDQGFRDWVVSSPIRQNLLRLADQYNVDAAHELFSTFKELKAVRQTKVPDEEKASREKMMTSAAVDTGGSGETSKKVYRRADLILLKLRDPAKFSAMQDVIDAAYREGRVRG